MFLLALLSPSAFAATLTVGSSGDYTNIQDAIDAASDGDTISVEAGTYSETLSVTKDIAIVGAGSDSTTLSADGTGVSWSGASASLSGFFVLPVGG